MQTKQLHLRLHPDDMDGLKAIADSAGLNPTMLGQILVKAGLAAIQQNSGRFPMPLHFLIKEPEEKKRLVRRGNSAVLVA